MRGAIRWGVVLGLAVGLEHVVFAALGWHRVYRMSFAFLAIAIAINTATVVLCLRELPLPRSWLAQVQAGGVVGLVGSGLIFVSSWFVAAVLFPDYFPEMAEGYRTSLEDMGLTDAELDQAVAGLRGTTALRSSIEGVVGTLAVTVIVTAIAALFLRGAGPDAWSVERAHDLGSLIEAGIDARENVVGSYC